MGAIARSDVELVEASRRGEHEAFGHLVARYQDVVCAVSYSSTGDPGLSEDVAQETFIAAWRQLDRLRDTARLRPWLCGIARNLARNARKRRRREDVVDGDEHVATDASPFETTARGEAERVVREALARIPAAYREVLVLYYRDGQSIREVAATLGASEASAMQRLSRARRYLADSVHELVERSLQDQRPRRDLVAAVLAAIAVIMVAPRVDASPTKGSTMMKLAIAASAAAAIGTTTYLVHARNPTLAPSTPAATAAPLHYGSGQHGLAHAPTLGPTAAPHALPSRRVAQADLALLPADSEEVIGLNFAQLRQSALGQRLVAPQLAQLARLAAIQNFEAKCGFDPITSLESVSIGVKDPGHQHSMTGVVVIHGFEKTKVMPCFEAKAIPYSLQHGATVKMDGEVVLITDGASGKHSAFVFTDPKTAILVFGPDGASRQAVEAVIAGKNGVTTSSVFSDALQYVNTDASIWMMVGEGSPLLGRANTELAKHDSVKLGTSYLSLQITDTLAIDAGVRLGSPDTVARVVSAVQSRLSAPEARAKISQYFDQLDVAADGPDLIISAAMTGEQVLHLAMHGVKMRMDANVNGSDAPQP
jgi:RNA polymerase sigma factor (sigma-70 family)